MAEAMTFYYNVNQQRNNSGAAEAQGRYIASRLLKGEKVKVKPNGKIKNSEMHHIDHCRSNGHKNNLFVCKSQQQHQNLHFQTQQYIIESIQSGALGFDWAAEKYYVANEKLKDHIQEWRDAGRPLRHQNRNLRKEGHRVNGQQLAKSPVVV